MVRRWFRAVDVRRLRLAAAVAAVVLFGVAVALLSPPIAPDDASYGIDRYDTGD